MAQYIINLTETENKCLTHCVVDPQDWIENFVKQRCSVAGEEIFTKEVQRMLADPNITEIPADREAVILAADIQTAAEKHEKSLNNQVITVEEE